MPLFDPNTSGGYPAAFNTVYDTPGETITYASRRRVSHWGAAFELETPSSGAKTAPALAWKAGPAFRRIGQDFDLNSKGINLAGTSTGITTYSETLNTSYWGGYVGLIGKLRPAKGLSFTLDGEVGLYGAHTEYNGRYAASGATESGNPGANLSQSLALDRNTLAVIAALKLSAEQDFGALRLGAFVRGEYYSYAPSVAYNDTDLTGGVGQNLVGANNGTSLRNSNAFTFSTGARITVPLSQP